MRYLILMWITFLTGCSTTGQYSAGVPVYDIYELVDLDSGTEYQQVVSAYGSPTKRDSFSGEYTVAQYCNI